MLADIVELISALLGIGLFSVMVLASIYGVG